MTISSFTIHNFRTFEHLCLEKLQRVNLIAGDNNTGKTALLEALWQFMAPDQPDIGLRLNRFRGLDQFNQDGLLSDLFYQFDPLKTITLEGAGTWGVDHRVLEICQRPRETSSVDLQPRADGADPNLPTTESRHELILRYREGEGISESRGWLSLRAAAPGLTQQSFEVSGQNAQHKDPAIIFPARYRGLIQEDAERFGSIQLKGLKDEIVEALRPFEPNLVDLATVSIGGTPVLHVDVGTARLVPVSLLGDGFQRMLSVALAFNSAVGGIVLFDEVENGIHYSKLPDLWRAIRHFSSSFDVQVFATTHSGECIRAAHDVFADQGASGLGFYRLDRIDGSIVVKSLDQEMLQTAFDLRFEVR